MTTSTAAIGGVPTTQGLNAITSLLLAVGWANSSGTYLSPTVNGRTLSVTPVATSTGWAFTLPTVGGVSKTLYIDCNISDGQNTGLWAAASDRHLFVVGQGPVNTGSRQCFALLHVGGYHPSDLASRLVVAVGNTVADATVNNRQVGAFIRLSRNNVGWEEVRLKTLMQAVEPLSGDTASSFNIWSRNNLGQSEVSPYVVVEKSPSGTVGELADVYYLNRNKRWGTFDENQDWFVNPQDFFINRAIHRSLIPWMWSGGQTVDRTDAASPFGKVWDTEGAAGPLQWPPGGYVGGPWIAVRTQEATP